MFYPLLFLLICWVVFLLPPSPFDKAHRAQRRRWREERTRQDQKPNPLAPHEDPWHPDYKGQHEHQRD